MSTNNRESRKVFQPPENLSKSAHCKSLDDYRELYSLSLSNPNLFWENVVKEYVFWRIPPLTTPRESEVGGGKFSQVSDSFMKYNFDVTKGKIFIKCLEGGKTNVCYNVLDRNITKRGLAERVAVYWEGNFPNDTQVITYGQLLREVSRLANVLKAHGIVAGDRVAVYMPMIPELLMTMLACARIGAVHSLVFGGFSSGALADRILDAKCNVVVTADGAWRGTKLIELKKLADDALKICAKQGHVVGTCLVVRHISSASASAENSHVMTTNACAEDVEGKRPVGSFKVPWTDGRDYWWHDEMASVSDNCEPEWLDAEHPLFMLYTSGSTGKPKGVLHTSAGYLIHVAVSYKYVFDHQPDDVFWCTGDLGWVTGHSYGCYGPLANGTTLVIFEGIPTYPDCSRFWQVIDKYRVTKFYTAPTAIRQLMKFGDEPVKRYKRESLKVLGSVGEPINPEAWLWYHDVVGNGRCAIVDTYWQTETGGMIIVPLPGAIPTKPGSATLPFFGVIPEILAENGNAITGEGEGYLAFQYPWPGMMRTVFGNHERFEATYFKKFPGYYCTGDGARRDSDGYIWLTGRIDDMLNVSGHLLSTTEVEGVLVEHPSVAESAAVARPHEVKGECLYCFVTLKEGKAFSEQLVAELKDIVRRRIGAFAQPDYVQEAPALPKTRSGKILRRILRKVAVDDRDIGDTTTLVDESVINVLFENRSRMEL